MRCDSGQNVFIRAGEAPGNNLPILELDSEGKKLRHFDPSQAKQDGIDRASVRAYTVTQDGSVYELLTVQPDKVAVLHFSPAGEYAGAVYLDKSFNAAHLAVFRTGELLVDGTAMTGGQFLRSFHGDLRSHRPAARANPNR